MSNWTKITCEQSDALLSDALRTEDLHVYSGLTDMDGHYTGTPYLLTIWGTVEGELQRDGHPVLKNERWPDTDRPCEHHQWTGDWDTTDPNRWDNLA